MKIGAGYHPLTTMAAAPVVAPQRERIRTGIVLSGGGARGAYEAGIVAGMMEVLQPTRAPFDIFCGTSVGALNAAYLAAHADMPDMNAPGLISHWQSLDIDRHLRLDLRGLLGWKQAFSRPEAGIRRRHGSVGRSLLDPEALAHVVTNHVPWERLHENVGAGVVRALIIAALDIGTGRTTLFSELAPDQRFVPSRDPRRRPSYGPIGASHVLASAAIPMIFPPQLVGDSFYCDGGVRFNTPIAPAIRCGAERLVVISLLGEDELDESAMDATDAYSSPFFLLGKVLDALLMDPLRYDLQVLERFNRLVQTVTDVLTPEELLRVQKVVTETRGLPYRQLRTLVFKPSRDIGRMARDRSRDLHASRFSSWMIARAASLGAVWESDLLSFILFDAEFATQLVHLGRHDAVSRAAEIRAFFAPPTQHTPTPL